MYMTSYQTYFLPSNSLINVTHDIAPSYFLPSNSLIDVAHDVAPTYLLPSNSLINVAHDVAPIYLLPSDSLINVAHDVAPICLLPSDSLINVAHDVAPIYFLRSDSLINVWRMHFKTFLIVVSSDLLQGCYQKKNNTKWHTLFWSHISRLAMFLMYLNVLWRISPIVIHIGIYVC